MIRQLSRRRRPSADALGGACLPGGNGIQLVGAQADVACRKRCSMLPNQIGCAGCLVATKVLSGSTGFGGGLLLLKYLALCAPEVAEKPFRFEHMRL